jgi:hypothetical protein
MKIVAPMLRSHAFLVGVVPARSCVVRGLFMRCVLLLPRGCRFLR